MRPARRSWTLSKAATPRRNGRREVCRVRDGLSFLGWQREGALSRLWVQTCTTRCSEALLDLQGVGTGV